MPRVAIPDTSCLIGLACGGLLDVLPRMYSADPKPGDARLPGP